MKEVIYEWQFSDKKQRGSLWYVLAASIALGLIIWGFLTSQYGMSFIILLISGIYFFVENNSSEEIIVEVSDQWIKVENSFYDIWSIDSYCFVFHWESPYYLRLFLNKKWLRQIDIRIDDERFWNLQNILPNILNTSESKKLTFSEKLIILLKL